MFFILSYLLGAGKFSVQGISIDGVHYNFPTLTLASETRENLADMKVLVLKILSTASGISSEILWSKIHFSMTDSTSHNMEVDDKVAEKLGSDHVPEPDHISDAEKNARMYVEVRYAKNTSLSFPKSSDVFRLKKKYKNLSTQEYSSNLKTYLNKVTCKVNMDYNDFQSALMSLKSSQ